MAMQYYKFTVRGDGLDDREARQYEASVLGMLHAFETIQTARALLDGFRAYNREVLVIPNPDILECNAHAKSDWGMFRTKIEFTPGIYYADDVCNEGGAGDTPHEVFCHELVHALRYVSGDNHKHTTTAQEERIAIMVTNIFSSETHKPLRRRHRSHDILRDPVKSTSAGFLAANRHLIGIFVAQHPNISAWLAAVNALFNPLREYYRERGVTPVPSSRPYLSAKA